MELKQDDLTRGKWIINSTKKYNKTRVTIQEASDGSLVICLYGTIRIAIDMRDNKAEIKGDKEK